MSNYCKIILLITLIFSGCKRDIQHLKTASGVTDEYLLKIYGSIGNIHNEGLDVVYEGLKSGKIKDSITFKTTLDQFISRELSTDAGKVDYFVNYNGYGVTRNVKAFKTELFGHLEAADQIMNNFLRNHRLTLTEKKMIIGMASVAKASDQYWAVNQGKWTALKNQLSGYAARGTGNGKTIVLADAIGAGTGAVRGAWVGAFGGSVAIPGIGTVAGAAGCGLVGMVGGAIYSSASAGLMGWIEDWFTKSKLYADADPAVLTKDKLILSDLIFTEAYYDSLYIGEVTDTLWIFYEPEFDSVAAVLEPIFEEPLPHILNP